MERQDGPIDNSPLESSLMDLILNTKSEKIRRPPNAFMLFARDHRRLVSRQHPDVSNKGVSSLLGKIWKSTALDVKEKYYKKAKIFGDLHKRRYPDYVYSPRDARIQKMNKKKKKDEANSADAATQRENLAAVMELTKRDDISNEEEWITDPNNDRKSSPEYIPNNPEYFAQQSPEEDETSDLRPRSGQQDLPLQTNQGCWTEKNCGCCHQSRLGPGVRCAPAYEKRENEGVMPHFPDHIPCSYATASPFCSPQPHFTGPMSSYCCGPRPCTSPIPRPYGPLLHPYWNPPPCYPGREYFYEDLKPYPFSTPYHVPDIYGPYGYFSRPLTQPKKNLDTSFHPHLREGPEFPGRGQDGSEADNTGPYSYFGRSDAKEENVHSSFDSCLRKEDEMTLLNRRILRSSVKNREQMVHENQANRTGIRPQDVSSSHTSMPTSEESSLLAERRHFNSHFYPNLWDSHYSEDKSPRMTSTDSVSKEQYQCDSTRRNENPNSSDLANNCRTQSEDVLSPTLSPESRKRKLGALYAEGNDDPVTSTHPKLYRLSILPTSEATRPYLCSSAVEKSSLTKGNIQEMFNKPVTTLDQTIYTNSENNMSVTSSNNHLSNINKISASFVIGTQDKNRSGNTVDQQGVPLNLSFSKLPIQMTKECSKEFDSSDLQNNQIVRKSHDLSANVQQSQIYKPLVKMEFNDQNIYSINGINEKNIESRDDKNNNFRVGMEHEAFTWTTAKQNINSIKGNVENNSFVISNKVAENIPHSLTNIVSHENMADNSKYDLSKAYFEPVVSEENFPGFRPLSSQTLISSSGVAKPVLQSFIKMEDNGKAHFKN